MQNVIMSNAIMQRILVPLMVLRTDTRLDFKVLRGTNTVAYFSQIGKEEKTVWVDLTPSPNVIKLFTTVIYNCL